MPFLKFKNEDSSWATLTHSCLSGRYDVNQSSCKPVEILNDDILGKSRLWLIISKAFVRSNSLFSHVLLLLAVMFLISVSNLFQCVCSVFKCLFETKWKWMQQELVNVVFVVFAPSVRPSTCTGSCCWLSTRKSKERLERGCLFPITDTGEAVTHTLSHTHTTYSVWLRLSVTVRLRLSHG